jgi:hypothetical protein
MHRVVSSSFILDVQVTDDVRAHLKEANVDIKDYDKMLLDVRDMAVGGLTLWLDPAKVPPPRRACKTFFLALKIVYHAAVK